MNRIVARLRDGTFLSTVAKRVRWFFKNDPTRFLRRVRGVVHVGANSGQERDLYVLYGVRVAWIEPIAEVYEALRENVREIPDQRAFCYLITDRDDAEYEFHVASNNGGSSSILPFNLHRELWPRVTFERSLRMKSATLATMFEREALDPRAYDALVMDTQGSELLVLEGAVPLLQGFNFIKTEVADFDAYAGCCKLPDVEAFMHRHGFEEMSRTRFAEKPGIGAYYDIVYRRVARSRFSGLRGRHAT